MEKNQGLEEIQVFIFGQFSAYSSKKIVDFYIAA